MRTIRDEDRQSRRDDREPVTIEGVRCVRATAAAILVVVGKDDDDNDREVWIPQSQVTDDSEVYAEGHEGKLVITHWIADQKGLV